VFLFFLYASSSNFNFFSVHILYIKNWNSVSVGAFKYYHSLTHTHTHTLTQLLWVEKVMLTLSKLSNSYHYCMMCNFKCVYVCTMTTTLMGSLKEPFFCSTLCVWNFGKENFLQFAYFVHMSYMYAVKHNNKLKYARMMKCRYFLWKHLTAIC
jgi:hypothetical protein